MKLKDILDGCLFTDGDWIESKDQDPNGEIRLIQLADIGDGFFIDKSSRFINRETAKKLRCTFLEKNDILIARMPDPLGRACVFPLEENEKYVTAVDVCIIRTNENCNNRYLQYCLNSTDIRNSIERQKTGTTRERITRKKLGELDIPLPPLPQQQKIANILDAADALRQNDKALIAKYDELTQALFLDMFGDPVSNPKGWKKVEFGKHIAVLTDYHSNGSYETLNENVKLKNTPDYALMVRTTDLEKNDFEKDVISISRDAYNYLEKTKVYGGEMIINKIGSAGKVYRMPFLNRPVSLGMNAFMLRFNDTLNSNFIYFLLKTKYGEREISKRVKGAVTKTIRKDAVREIPILLPPLELQNQFAERVAVIEEQKAIAQKSLEKSESLFNSLLQKAFKGELA